MKSKVVQMICRLLIISMISLSFQAAHAGMIGVDKALSAGSSQADRDTVLRTLSRADVSSQLQSMGLDPRTAADRVAAMTDQEVHSLAGKLETLPAGADDWWWILGVIIIGVAVYYIWGPGAAKTAK